MRIRNLGLLAVVVALLLVVKVIQDRGHRSGNLESDTAVILAAADSTAAAEAAAEATDEPARPRSAADLVNAVTIRHGADEDGEVTLTRLGDGWVARSAWSHPADARKVEDLIESMIGLQGEFRSDSPDVLGQYGLGPDASPVTVTLHGADWSELSGLEIGNRGTDGRGVFVRVPGRDIVFWTAENILAKAGLYSGPAAPESKFFLDLAVQSCAREDVEEIRLFRHDADVLTLRKTYAEPDSAGVVDRGTWDWVLVSPETRPLSRTKADGVMAALTNVRAVDVADPDAPLQQYGLVRADRRVEYDLADGRTFELRFGAPVPTDEEASPEVYVMSGLDTKVWILREFTAEQIFKTVEDLLPDE